MARRFLIEQILRVEFKPEALDFTHLEFLPNHEIRLIKNRCPAPIAAAIHEYRNLVRCLHQCADRRAASQVEKSAEVRGAEPAPVLRVAAVQFEYMRPVCREAARDILALRIEENSSRSQARLELVPGRAMLPPDCWLVAELTLVVGVRISSESPMPA